MALVMIRLIGLIILLDQAVRPSKPHQVLAIIRNVEAELGSPHGGIRRTAEDTRENYPPWTCAGST